MYLETQPPTNALFQGDIVVVPRFDPDPDPHILRHVAWEKPAECVCGQQPTAKGREWRRSATSVQLKDNPDLFAEKREVAGRLDVMAALIISHSCDIDAGDAITVCPIVQWSSIETKYQLIIEDPLKKTPYMVLQPVGRMPKAAVNFEWQFSLPSRFLGKPSRFRTSSGRSEPWLKPYDEVIASRVATLDDPAMLQAYNKLAERIFRPKELILTMEGSSRMVLDSARPLDLARRGFAWPLPEWFGAEPAQGILTPLEVPVVSDGPNVVE